MDKDTALQQAIELAKITIQQTKDISPTPPNAEHIANFIETLAKRLDDIGSR